MAGQRMYYSNVLTTTKGAVRATCQISLAGTGVASIVAGRGFSVSGSNTTTFTLYLPERYGQNSLTWQDLNFVPLTSANSPLGFVSQTYTVPTTGASYVQFQVVVPNGAGVTTVAAVANPKGLMYCEFDFELGM